MPPTLVIGGAGFIGIEVSRLLLEAGGDVVILGRGKEPLALPVGCRYVQGDYANRSETWLRRQRAARHGGLSPTRVGRAGLSLIMMHVARQSLALDPPDFELAPRIGHIDVRNFTRADERLPPKIRSAI